MKKKVVFSSIIVLFLLAIFTMAGCREEDPPILSVEIKPTQVVYNGSATLTWQGENLTSLRIIGIDQSKLNFGSMSLNNLQENMTYDFVAIGLDGTTISRSVSIQVGEPIPELKVMVIPNTVVPYKGSATVGWEGKNLASLKVNGVNSSELKYGSIPLTNLVEDTTFNFVAIGLDGSTLNQSALVKVAEPTKLDTMMALLCNKPWKLDDISHYTMEGKFIYSSELDEFMKNDIYYFYPDGSRAVDRTAQGKGWFRTGPGDWSFSPDCTHIAFDKRTDYKDSITLTTTVFKMFSPSFILNAETGETRPITDVYTYKSE